MNLKKFSRSKLNHDKKKLLVLYYFLPGITIAFTIYHRSLIKEDRRVRIPWKTLIKLPKEIRKESIRELRSSNTVSEAVQLQRYIVILFYVLKTILQ